MPKEPVLRCQTTELIRMSTLTLTVLISQVKQMKFGILSTFRSEHTKFKMNADQQGGSLYISIDGEML